MINFSFRYVTKIKKEITIEKTILTFSGIFFEPRNGLEIKNEDSLIDDKKDKKDNPLSHLVLSPEVDP